MSKTLCIHPKDNSTRMLKIIYEDKDWDVISDCDIDKDELIKQIEAHDRIIMMGHGTGNGLFSTGVKNWGMIINDSLAPLLKTKETISIWCNSDVYFIRNGFHKGELHTGNVPSETYEMEWALGYCDMSAEEVYDNMVLYSTAIRDTIDKYKGQELVNEFCKIYNRDDALSDYNRKTFRII